MASTESSWGECQTDRCEYCCELIAHNCKYPSTPHILHPLSLPTSSIQYVHPSSPFPPHPLSTAAWPLIPQLALPGLQYPHLILQLPLPLLVPLQLLQLVPLHCPSAGPTSSVGEVARMEDKGTVQNHIQQLIIKPSMRTTEVHEAPVDTNHVRAVR